MSRPTLTIIAGANGAGKSALTAGSSGTFSAIPLLDPDAFANTLRSSGMGLSTIAAAKEVLRGKDSISGICQVVTKGRSRPLPVPSRPWLGALVCAGQTPHRPIRLQS